VVLSLRRQIISGKLKQGEPLAEPVLAERFGVSRAPVREALIELEREGLITFEATGRTRVRTLTRRDFEEIMEARSALESMASQLAAARWSVEDSAAMEKNIAAQSKASTIAELSRLDVEFHAYVMRRSGNERLLRLWQSIRWQFEMSLACTHRLQQKQAFKPPQMTIDTHRRMLAALASGKPEVAGRTMAAHMKESIGWLHGKELGWETTPSVKAAAPISRGRGLVRTAVKLVLVTLLGSLTMDASAEADYMKDIKPLLKERCYECHGAMKQKAKLRLDTVALMLKGGENGPAFERGKPQMSTLIERVASTDDDERMPPKHEGTPLTAAQVALLREWIAAGAPAPTHEKAETDPKEHWAFLPRVRPAVPVVANAKWVRNPIDAFLAKQHEEHGLTPQPEASRAVLLRRLYLDLIGLPPTADEITAFENDTAPDCYERTVKRLLDDKRHGERWARHWMDVWRYSDWWGLGGELRNSQKNIWHWRDWIVESLNVGKPYDEMVRQMLAADELYPNDLQKLRATGFLARNWFLFNRHQWMEETVEHVSKGFLGITMNCTKCHDHKYDPISQADFYKLRAFFEPYQVRMDMVPGETDLSRDGIPRVFDAVLDAPTYRFVRGDETKPDKSAAIAPGVPEVLAFKKLEIKPVSLPLEAWQPERRPWVLDAHLSAARKKVESAAAAIPTAKAKLAAAEKRHPNLIASHPVTPTAPAPSTLNETFATLDTKRWKLLGGDWTHQPGRLEQKRVGAKQSAARLLERAPRDFDATMRFTILGGSVWRSVGLLFDVSQADPSKPAVADDSEILVFASAVSGGPKVQAAFGRGGAWQYPGEGVKAMPVHLGREYTLRVQARDTLINVSLNGEPLLAWRSPLARRDGAIQMITFDAKAVFHGFTIAPLKADVALSEPRAAVTPANAKTALVEAKAELNVAELALAWAKAELTSAECRAEAMRASWDKGESEPAKAAAAVRAERTATVAEARHAVADAELRLARAAAAQKPVVQKQLVTARASLDTAVKTVATPPQATDKFTPLAGAKWTPTRFASSTADDPAPPFSATSTGRRSALADWITDPRNPLTARVAVNHLWLRHMGEPFVPSMFEFGRKSAAPLHPELLDWLASELVESGWDMKHLHRLIVTSAAYRMSSSALGGEASATKDSDNLRWWRRAPIRIESQAVRDSILALAGELDLTMGGPPVPMAAQAASKRRSLYFTHSNNERNTFLTLFDEADVRECYRRDQSIVPQQALALSNSSLVLDSAGRIAARLGGKIPPEDEAAFVRAAFRGVLCTAPSEAEIAACLQTLSELRKLPGTTPAQVRAHFVWALLNHNDFVTLR
jgi:DNA-binding GntR family transcriptional regulator